MYCPRCGTQNSKTSKFCRECGRRLIFEGIETEDQLNEVEEQQVVPMDDTAVAELLYDTLKLYERGKIESAFAKCKLALRTNPDSPSARSLLGLIYEKKADDQTEKGLIEDAQDYYHAAIRQVERVLEANPDSIADREKLDELHAKLSSLTEEQEVKRAPIGPKIAAVTRRVPPAWAAAAVVTLIVFLILLPSLLGGGRKPEAEAEPSKQEAKKTEAQTQTGRELPPPVYTPSSPAWTYQPETQPAAPSQDYTPEPQTGHQPTQPSVSNEFTLPSLDPYSTRPPQSSFVPPSPNEQQPAAPSTPEKKASERAREAYLRGDYDTAASSYQEAISSGEDTGENHQKLGMCLYNLNKREAALNHFQRAVELYKAQKASGGDSAALSRAIDTCRLYIDDLSRR